RGQASDDCVRIHQIGRYLSRTYRKVSARPAAPARSVQERRRRDRKSQIEAVNRSSRVSCLETDAECGGSREAPALEPMFGCRIYDLRSTYATRLSAGGVADEWVTQLLRQGDAQVFKKYSQMKLQMKREALQKMNRRANEPVLVQAG